MRNLDDKEIQFHADTLTRAFSTEQLAQINKMMNDCETHGCDDNGHKCL